MDDEFQDLQRLLRMKRHEVPPPAYFEDFMAKFHRRQREELLRRPLWRLALDRFEAALPNFSPTRYAYAGATAMAVVAASLVSTRILTAPTAELGRVAAARPVADLSPKINIYSPRPSTRLAPDLNFDEPHRVVAAPAKNRTRYVLDAPSVQPVVYEQRSNF